MEMSLSPWTDFDKEKTILSYCNCSTSASKQKRGTTNPKKTDGQNHHTEDKREGQRKAKRHTTSKQKWVEIPT
jgi:hypothetical protein